jgi:hypothetical protein
MAKAGLAIADAASTAAIPIVFMTFLPHAFRAIGSGQIIVAAFAASCIQPFA